MTVYIVTGKRGDGDREILAVKKAREVAEDALMELTSEGSVYREVRIEEWSVSRTCYEDVSMAIHEVLSDGRGHTARWIYRALVSEGYRISIHKVSSLCRVDPCIRVKDPRSSRIEYELKK